MQALHSSVTYVSDEVRRAAKPIIDTLAPIVPTFGCGEAEVKESLDDCFKKMEVKAIADNASYEKYLGWTPDFSNFKKIILYPIREPAKAFEKIDKCHPSSEIEVGMIVSVANTINRQLTSWGIPFQFEISSEHKDVVLSESEGCANDALVGLDDSDNNGNGLFQNGEINLFFAHCDTLQDNGVSVGGYMDQHYLGLQSNPPRAHIAHELSHVFSPHVFDSIPLSSLHPDVVEAMCHSVSHGGELITVLSYATKCKEMGFDEFESHLFKSKGEWGPIDLTMAKLGTHQSPEEIHQKIRAEGVDQCYEWIRKNYGKRIAEQFTASFVKSVFIHTMSAVAVRTFEDKRILRFSRVMIHLFGNLLQLGMMTQLSHGSTGIALLHFLGASGVLGRTVRSIIDVTGDAALLRSFVQLMRGNSDTMLQLVYAVCGTAAGNAFSQAIHGFIDMCAPADTEQRNAYLNMTQPTGLGGLIFDESTKFFHGEQSIEQQEQSIKRLPEVMRAVITIDRSIGSLISNYLSLQVMTTWLWKKDQQKADAQVHASVDNLSATLEEVKIKYGATNLRQRKPAETRSPHPTTPVQPVSLDAVDDDDPLLMTDGAAVTGIGNASLHQKQQRLLEKKQQ
jgi:hypothetical protein